MKARELFFGIAFSLWIPATSAYDHAKILSTDGRSALARRLIKDLNDQNLSNNRTSDAAGPGLPFLRNATIDSGKRRLCAGKRRCASNAISTLGTRYLIKDLGTLGGTESFAYAINNSGHVVGISRTSDDAETHSFLYRGGNMIDLSPVIDDVKKINLVGQIAGGALRNGVFSPILLDSTTNRVITLGSLGGNTQGRFNGVATSVNTSGQVVGDSYIDSEIRHAFLYADGIFKDLGSFGGYSGATAINDNGTVVGFGSNGPNGKSHAFIYTETTMIDIDPLRDPTFSTSESYARDINNHGQVVGEYLSDNKATTRAFIYRKGKVKTFAKPGSPYTVALGNNDFGQIVGVMDIPYKDTCIDPTVGVVTCVKHRQHAFHYRKGQLTDLNAVIDSTDGWELSWAFDVNSHGQIVGYGLKESKYRAFVLTPY
jgi:probable HAF family extracellular repeat protein